MNIELPYYTFHRSLCNSDLGDIFHLNRYEVSLNNILFSNGTINYGDYIFLSRTYFQ